MCLSNNLTSGIILGEKKWRGMITIHCDDCDSPKIIMLNANCTWSVEKQEWQYSENVDPVYQCNECGADNVNYNMHYTEKETISG